VRASCIAAPQRARAAARCRRLAPGTLDGAPVGNRRDWAVATAGMTTTRLEELLGDDAQDRLTHRCETISADSRSTSAPAAWA
jgi:hypothetical protein